MQGTQLQSLVQEDSTRLRATKLVHRNYRVCVLQILKPACLEPVLRSKGSHHKEKPAHNNQDSSQLEKVQVQQQRPRAAKKIIIITNFFKARFLNCFTTDTLDKLFFIVAELPYLLKDIWQHHALLPSRCR